MDAHLLKYYCYKNGFSLARLAEALGMSESTLYRKISGDSDFYRHEIIEIRGILKLSPDEISKIFFDRELALTQE